MQIIELVWSTREGKELFLTTRFDLFIKSRKVYSINVTLIGPASGRHAPRTEVCDLLSRSGNSRFQFKSLNPLCVASRHLPATTPLDPVLPWQRIADRSCVAPAAR